MVLAGVIWNEGRGRLEGKILWWAIGIGCALWAIPVVFDAQMSLPLLFSENAWRDWYIVVGAGGRVLIGAVCLVLLYATAVTLFGRPRLKLIRGSLLALLPLLCLVDVVESFRSFEVVRVLTKSPHGWMFYGSALTGGVASLAYYVGFSLSLYVAMGLPVIRSAAEGAEGRDVAKLDAR
jgi:hypothetical protein